MPISILTFSRTGVVQSSVDSIGQHYSGIVLDGVVIRQCWRTAVAPIGVDAPPDVLDVLPTAFQPNVVAPGSGVTIRFDALHKNLLWVPWSSDDIPWQRKCL